MDRARLLFDFVVSLYPASRVPVGEAEAILGQLNLLGFMDQPLGTAVGNALEIAEARDTVRGEGPPDFTELVLDACARLLALSDLGVDIAEGRGRAEAAVADGSALAVYERWIRAQGGDPNPAVLPQAPFVLPVKAPRAGSVTSLGAIAKITIHRRLQVMVRPPRSNEPDIQLGAETSLLFAPKMVRVAC